MLIIMTFNTGLFVVIVVGSTVGYFLFAGNKEGNSSVGTGSGGNGGNGNDSEVNGTEAEKVRLYTKRNSNGF